MLTTHVVVADDICSPEHIDQIETRYTFEAFAEIITTRLEVQPVVASFQQHIQVGCTTEHLRVGNVNRRGRCQFVVAAAEQADGTSGCHIENRFS